MHYNRRTSALLAAGIVSLAALAQAEEKATAIQSALSSTTISGYVDTSAQWNFGTGTGPAFYTYGAGKADGFNLNVVQLSISKPLDESEWASGYTVDLWFGPDANTLGTFSGGTGSSTAGAADLAVKQAYVALRTPVGNGIDWKIGVFDTIIGYESSSSPSNPNFTRSYGYTLEPTTHTGFLGTYKFCDEFSLSAGVANTHGPTINQRAFIAGVPGAGAGATGAKAESYKTYMAAAAFTAPQNWGWAAGSTLYGGVINGFSGNGGGILPGNGNGNMTSWYAGATVATPVTGLKVGAAFDYLDSRSNSGSTAVAVGNDMYALGVYGSYQATEKLSFHARGELFNGLNPVTGGKDDSQIWELTGTVQYDLWENVISRLEFRWDHADEGNYFGASHPFGLRNSVLVAANIVYKF
jgi:hypothetical protein